jgi:hypothetical protein
VSLTDEAADTAKHVHETFGWVLADKRSYSSTSAPVLLKRAPARATCTAPGDIVRVIDRTARNAGGSASDRPKSPRRAQGQTSAIHRRPSQPPSRYR